MIPIILSKPFVTAVHDDIDASIKEVMKNSD